jgi:Protein of unknown function (DUF1579)
MRMTWIPLLGAGLLFVAGPALAQPAMPKPGPEQEKLKVWVGDWDATVSAMGTETKGSATYKMGFGGLWLTGNFTGEFAGQKFEGRATAGYDSFKKKYVSSWIDSMSPSILIMEGSFSPDGKSFTEVGEGPGMDGKMQKMKTVYQFKDKDTILMTMTSLSDGKDQESIKITYKRKK